MEVNKIYQGDALSVLKTFPDNFVDMCITSPPYWKLRNYQVEGQIGQEANMDWYLMNLVDIFTEVGRVLKPTGSLWVNLGDTFNGSKKGNTNNKQKQGVNTNSFQKFPEQMIKEKSMLMIPERFAIIMLDYGWILRNKVVWHKRNAMPQSAPDRFTLDWEYLYHFTKNKKYYWEQQYRPLSESTMKEIQKMYTGQATKDYDSEGVQNPSDTKRRIIRSIRFGGDKADGYGRRTYSGKIWEPTIIKYGSGNITFKAKTGSKDDPNRGLHTGSWSDKKQARVRGPQPGTRTYDNAIKLGWDPTKQSYADWYFTRRQKKSWHDHSNDSEGGFGHQRGQKPLQLDHPLGSKMRSMWSISTRSFSGARFLADYVGKDGKPYKASQDCPIHAHLAVRRAVNMVQYGEQLADYASRNPDIPDGRELKPSSESLPSSLNPNCMKIAGGYKPQNQTNIHDNKSYHEHEVYSSHTQNEDVKIDGHTKDTRTPSKQIFYKKGYWDHVCSQTAILHNMKSHKSTFSREQCDTSFSGKSYDKRHSQQEPSTSVNRHGICENRPLVDSSLNVTGSNPSVQNQFHSYDISTLITNNSGKHDKCVCSVVATDHFATFPVKLLETPILASCPPNGICLDPFIGSGTTGLAVLQLNRQFVGIEISEEYVKMANERIKPYISQSKLII